MSVSTNPDVSVPGRLEEVADGVFAYVQADGSWMINNTGFLVARDGVTAVDACSTERRTRAFLDTIASVARLQVRTLVNTHHHPDHGRERAASMATIVAHDNLRDVPASRPESLKHRRLVCLPPCHQVLETDVEHVRRLDLPPRVQQVQPRQMAAREVSGITPV